MILISHRGNINGKFESYENEPAYIEHAIELGYDVEIDLWVVDDVLYLGHDKPQYGITWEYFKDKVDKVWIHCKNIEAYNYFWHQEDDFTFVSNGIIWTYPGKHLTSRSIAVMPEINEDYWDYVKSVKIYGVCTDYVKKFISETSTVPVRAA